MKQAIRIPTAFVFIFFLIRGIQPVLADHAQEMNRYDLLILKLTQQSGGDAASKLADAIIHRGEIMLRLIPSHPEEAIKHALPDSVWTLIPPGLQKEVEHTEEEEGQFFAIIQNDFDHGTMTTDYALETTSGENLSLHFVGEAPDTSLSGKKVRVKGMRLHNQMLLESGSAVTSSSTSGDVLSLSASVVKKIAVIMVNFTDNTSQPWTTDTARSVVFTSTSGVRRYYETVSFGQWTFSGATSPDGDIFGWYTIPYSSATCDYTAFIAAAKSQAASNGFTSSAYNHVVVAWPRISSCSWGGIGWIGGQNSATNGAMNLRVIGHELGHNFKLHHANAFNCTSSGVRVPMGTNCTSTEYGDPFDIMGSSSSAHPNAFHVAQMGMMTAANTQTVTAPGTFKIAPVEITSAGVQSLRVPRAWDTSGNVTSYYYVDFRQPLGFDTGFGITNPIVNGVGIRIAPNYTSSVQSQLLDMTSATTSFADAPLLVGQTFDDPISGIQMTVNAIAPDGATVSVAFGSGTCLTAMPSLTLSPSVQWSYPGQPMGFSFSVKNNNSTLCNPMSFTVMPTVPAGWTHSPATATVTVASGASVTNTFTLTSPASALAGNYSFSETAASTTHSTVQSTASASSNLMPPDTIAPIVTISSPAANAVFRSKDWVTITATASDASGISSIQILTDGTVNQTCNNLTSCSTRYRARSISAGTHTLTVKAIDKANPANTGIATRTFTRR